MAIQRRRLGVTPTERPGAALVTRRSTPPAEAPASRRATRVIAKGQADDGKLVVHAPNTDEVYGDAVRTATQRIRPMRGGDYLHVSDLIHRCIRARALTEQYGLMPPSQTLTMSDIMTFAQGDAIHDEAKAMAREGAPHMTWGKWSCKCEFLFHHEPCTYSEIDQEETCPHCLGKVDHYHEVSFFDDEYGVVGNPDLLFYIPRSGAFHINEIKSISHEQWKELTRPKPEHVFQVCWYWLLMHRKGVRLTDRVSVIYFTKGWLFGNQSIKKEFMIDPQAELHRLDDMIADALAYKAHRLARAAGEENPTLPLRQCANDQTKQAKGCHACDVCFEV